MNKHFWKSRTFWGALILSAGRIAFAPADQRPAAISEGLGIVLAAIGVRDAIAKNGEGR